MLLLSALLWGCEVAQESEQRVSIGFLRGLYGGYPQLIGEEYVIGGEVVSSDRYGAFSGQLYIQDSTGGIAILIDHPRLHELYSVGDSVRVWCQGLTLGGYGGSVRLGGEAERDWQVSRLSMAEWESHSQELGPTASVALVERRIATLTAEDMGRRVVVRGVRLVAAGEPWPEKGTTANFAVVDDAQPSDTLFVRLTGHSDLQGVRLPSGVCDVCGVADYFAGDYQLTLLSPDGFLVR